MVVEAMC